MVPLFPSQLNRAGIPVDQGVALLQGGLRPVAMESIVIIMNKYGMHEKNIVHTRPMCIYIYIIIYIYYLYNYIYIAIHEY